MSTHRAIKTDTPWYRLEADDRILLNSRTPRRWCLNLLGDRRDHFETSGDVWDLFRTVVSERKAREFEPTIGALRDFLQSPDIAGEPAVSRQRIAETLALMQTLSAWGDEMLRLPPETLVKIMKLGARIQNLVRGGAAKR